MTRPLSFISLTLLVAAGAAAQIAPTASLPCYHFHFEKWNHDSGPRSPVLGQVPSDVRLDSLAATHGTHGEHQVEVLSEVGPMMLPGAAVHWTNSTWDADAKGFVIIKLRDEERGVTFTVGNRIAGTTWPNAGRAVQWTQTARGIEWASANMVITPCRLAGTVPPAEVMASDPARRQAIRGAVQAPIPLTVDAAEKEGLDWAVDRRPSNQPATTVAREFATASRRRCAPVAPGSPVRSGEMLLGSLNNRIDGFSSRTVARTFLQPLHYGRADSLVVRARRIGTGDTLRLLRGNSNWTADGWFYSLSLDFPIPGRWLMVATNRSDWGCFVITVR